MDYAKFLETVKKHNMFREDDNVLAAVSGGPDSMLMLNYLLRLKKEQGFGLAVMVLSHGFRPEGISEAEYVDDFCARSGIRCFLIEKDVAAFAAAGKLSLQDAGHRVRFREMERLRAEEGFTVFALGHHADDRAETILMNILRGTGLEGLASMLPAEERIRRPLLGFTKKEILSACASENIFYFNDSSNEKTDYLRNRIRHRLLPLLREEYNPSVDRAIISLGEIAADEEDCLRQKTEESFHACLISGERGRTVLDVSRLRGLHPAQQRRTVRKAFRGTFGEDVDMSFAGTRAVLQILGEERGQKELFFAGGCRVMKNYGKLVFYREEKEETADLSAKILKPGEETFFGDIRISVSAVDRLPDTYDDRIFAAVSGARAGEEITVRSRRPGDRFYPLGAPGEKKLKKVLIDRKIPFAERDRLPVFESGGEIIWVPGLPPSEKFRVGKGEKRILLLRASAFN